MNYIHLVIVIGLAVYGWLVIAQIAKQRAAHDLYCSVISFLEQLEIDGKQAWWNNPVSLDEYTEIKLVSKITFIEQRIGLIKRFYSESNETSMVTEEAIAELRSCLTISTNQFDKKISRKKEILQRINGMIGILLEENYAYINKAPWCLRLDCLNSMLCFHHKK